jgi:hypothetical protein
VKKCVRDPRAVRPVGFVAGYQHGAIRLELRQPGSLKASLVCVERFLVSCGKSDGTADMLHTVSRMSKATPWSGDITKKCSKSLVRLSSYRHLICRYCTREVRRQICYHLLSRYRSFVESENEMGSPDKETVSKCITRALSSVAAVFRSCVERYNKEASTSKFQIDRLALGLRRLDQ